MSQNVRDGEFHRAQLGSQAILRFMAMKAIPRGGDPAQGEEPKVYNLAAHIGNGIEVKVHVPPKCCDQGKRCVKDRKIPSG